VLYCFIVQPGDDIFENSSFLISAFSSLNLSDILNRLKNSKSKQSIFYKSLTNLLSIRTKQKAFHPNTSRTTLNMGSKIFCFQRKSIDKKQSIICLTNLSSKAQYLSLNKKFRNWKNLINQKLYILPNKRLKLEPFQTVWLSN